MNPKNAIFCFVPLGKPVTMSPVKNYGIVRPNFLVFFLLGGSLLECAKIPRPLGEVLKTFPKPEVLDPVSPSEKTPPPEENPQGTNGE